MMSEFQPYFPDLIHLPDQEYFRAAMSRYKEMYTADVINAGLKTNDPISYLLWQQERCMFVDHPRLDIEGLKLVLEKFVSGETLDALEFSLLLNKNLIQFPVARETPDNAWPSLCKGPIELSVWGRDLLYGEKISAVRFSVNMTNENMSKIFRETLSVEIPEHLKSVKNQIIIALTVNKIIDPLDDYIRTTKQQYIETEPESIQTEYRMNVQHFSPDATVVYKVIMSDEQDIVKFVFWLDQHPEYKYETEKTFLKNRNLEN